VGWTKKLELLDFNLDTSVSKVSKKKERIELLPS
jgi:hypothetical protein